MADLGLFQELDRAVLGPQKIVLKKYRSPRTDLTLYISPNIPGPMVDGHFAIATEAHDDAGLPHTLEHLVFMGSETYPYKGVLDSIANRCLAQGTNAWTDTDHTCYTLSCVGFQGFRNILPIYLDHILYPTITDASFVTEVYHVDGNGHDAGVVYCEMQARENKASSLMEMAMRRAIFPTASGYRYETGGILADLRRLTNARVKDFHAKFYRAENVSIIVTGTLSEDDEKTLMTSIAEFEEKMLKKGTKEKLPRPFSSEIPPLASSQVLNVPYPAASDAPSFVALAWTGPHVDDYELRVAHDILWDYLTDSSVSPLQKALVDCDDPLCSAIDVHTTAHRRCLSVCHFNNVPASKVDQLVDVFDRVVRDVAVKGFSKRRLAMLLHHAHATFTADLEESASTSLVNAAIEDFVYSSKPDLQERIDVQRHISALSAKPASFWTDLLKTSVVEAKRVVVKANPDPSLAEKLSNEDEERVKERVRTFDEAGLKEKKEFLEKAIATNDVEVPEKIIASVPVPDASHINLIPVVSVRNGTPVGNSEGAGKLTGRFSKSPLPFFWQLDHVPSAFVHINLYVDTSLLNSDERAWLEVYLEIMFEVAVEKDDGTILSHSKVVDRWTDRTISYSSSLGVDCDRNFHCGQFAQLLVVNVVCEVDKYEEVVVFLRQTLLRPRFEGKRVRNGMNRLLKTVKKHKQDAAKILSAMIAPITFVPESNPYAVQVFRQSQFMREKLETLKSNEAVVLKELSSLVSTLLIPGNVKLQKEDIRKLINFDELSDILAPWTSFFNQKKANVNTQIPRLLADMRALSAFQGQKFIVGLPSVESSFLTQTAEGPSFQSSDYGALLVAIEYLTTMEGPMWKQVRGLGLSYNFAMEVNLEKGMLSFHLHKSTNIAKAYQVSKDIVENYTNGKEVFEETMIEGAKSSVIFSLVEEENTVELAASNAFISFLSNVSIRANIESVLTVTRDDMLRVMKDWIAPLFDAKREFKKAGISLSKVTDVETFHRNV